jgi:hypothetical protein
LHWINTVPKISAYFFLIDISRINWLLKYTVRTVVKQLCYWRGYLIVTNS